MEHYILLGLLLAAITPALTGSIKMWMAEHAATPLGKLAAALSPAVYATIGWLVDTLLMGADPLSPEGKAALLTALIGALGGAKARDLVKYGKQSVMKEAA